MITASTNKKSQKIPAAELSALKKFYKQSDPKEAAAAAIGLSRPAIESIILRGTAKPESILKIRAVLNALEMSA